MNSTIQLEHSLLAICRRFQAVRFASSLAAEDMVITDVIARLSLPIAIFTLDTGRLHNETYEHLAAVQSHYPIQISTVHPQAADLRAYVQQHGINGFYDSLEARAACCRARKVLPLATALAGADAWITGLRRAQSETRTGLSFESTDRVHGAQKFNPLLDWDEAAVWAYLDHHKVPVHVLQTRGFRSLGCQPCTRALSAGEPLRAGRWWWERPEHKECGLHITNQEHTHANP
jgi:phosphoadenosine phosphosulfate reductase